MYLFWQWNEFIDWVISTLDRNRSEFYFHFRRKRRWNQSIRFKNIEIFQFKVISSSEITENSIRTQNKTIFWLFRGNPEHYWFWNYFLQRRNSYFVSKHIWKVKNTSEKSRGMMVSKSYEYFWYIIRNRIYSSLIRFNRIWSCLIENKLV